MRVSIILGVALCAVGVGLGASIRAWAFPSPTVSEQCQVLFLDGPQQGNTEPVTFRLVTDSGGLQTGQPLSGGLTASSSQYIGGVSEPGGWSYTDTTEKTINFTFSAQLAMIPGATLTVITTIPVGMTTVVGTSQGTIVNSNGDVLGVAHTTTTCPGFQQPPPQLQTTS
ncbi:MAG: hypothetical protein ACREP9_13405 [Candidatus Dormibacteraceae bacterium]